MDSHNVNSPKLHAILCNSQQLAVGKTMLVRPGVQRYSPFRRLNMLFPAEIVAEQEDASMAKGDVLVGVDTESSTDGDEISVVVNGTDPSTDGTGEVAHVKG